MKIGNTHYVSPARQIERWFKKKRPLVWDWETDSEPAAVWTHAFSIMKDSYLPSSSSIQEYWRPKSPLRAEN